MSYEVILKACEGIETKLRSTTEIAAHTKTAIDTLGTEQRVLADRVLQLEQKGGPAAPADLRTHPAEAKGPGAVLLRTAADFKSHFREPNAERVSVADFLRGVAGMKTSALATKALSVGTDSAGGYAVPRATNGDILAALAPVSALLQAGAAVEPVGDVKSLTTAVVNAIPTAAWRLENGAVAESDPTFRSVVATPQSLSFRFKVSRELLMDAPNMNQALEFVIAQAMARALDKAGLRGTGVLPEPLGLLNTPGIYSVGSGVDGAAGPGYDTVLSVFDDILAANGPMPKAAIMAPRSWVRLMAGTDTTGQPKQMPEALRNLAFVPSSNVPINLTVGASTDCSELYVGDFSRMSIMLREALSIQLLNEQYAENGQIGFVGHVRADFSIWYPAAFAVVTGLR